MRREQLEYLRAIKIFGSITAASEKVHASAQSISASIKTLEKELGFELLKRSHQGVTLTVEGEILLKTASSFFSKISDIKNSKENPKELVELHIMENAAETYAVAFVEEILYAHDDLELHFDMRSVEVLKSELKENQIDSYFAIVPKIEQRSYDENKTYAAKYTFDLGQIATLYCLVPKRIFTYHWSKIPIKALQDMPIVFKSTPYKEASIESIIKSKVTLKDEISIDSFSEYRLKILTGDRIGLMYVNEYSEWWGYKRLLDVIPLEEKITLNLLFFTNSEDTIKKYQRILQGTRFEKELIYPTK